MSSCEIIQLPPSGYLGLCAHQLPEVLRPILHTIIFHRSLGLIRPYEVDSELFDLTWVRAAPLWGVCIGGTVKPPSFDAQASTARRSLVAHISGVVGALRGRRGGSKG